jgi:hypothetical protein
MTKASVNNFTAKNGLSEAGEPVLKGFLYGLDKQSDLELFLPEGLDCGILTFVHGDVL